MLRSIVLLAALWLSVMATPVQAARALTEGQKAPLFQAPSMRNDSMFDLSKYRGKVVYLEFWASWCPNCWDAMPELQALRAALREEGLKDFEVIGVNVNDSQADAEDAMKKFKVTFPLVRPFDDWVMRQYGIKALPFGVLVDGEGTIQAIYMGLSGSDQEALKKKVRRLLWKGL